ncbi:hypothetical protein HRJ45_24360 [Vibrio coralliilyticus]|nr:hypothetical protein [Vibrio coralliilyticus]NRF82246.1 hypothetical protein [Vibrio coralliilyticus]
MDENGVVDTSGVDTSFGDVDVTIQWQGQGALSGQSGGESLTVTAPDFATLAGGACGGELNDSDPSNATGECLKIATATVGGQYLWFTSSPSVAMMEAMGYTVQDDAGNTGNTYADTYQENGSRGPSGGTFARFRQDGMGYNTASAEDGQLDRYCQDLAYRNFAGKDDWRRAQQAELGGLHEARGNLWDNYGWPVYYVHWSSTPSGTKFEATFLETGDVNDYWVDAKAYASCVSGS